MITNIATDSIKTAKYNPKARVEQISQLVKSIKEYGIIIPLVVDADKNLIDGHRRLASAKKLKLEKVPTILMDSKISKDKAYEIVNGTSKKLTSKDWIYIHINGGSVPARILGQINIIEEIVGADGLKKLGYLSCSYRVMDVAYRIRKYCHDNTEAFLKRTVFWIANNGMTFAVRRAMENKIKKEVIARAIALNKPLKIKYDL